MTINEAYELVFLKWTLLKKEFDKDDDRDLNDIYDSVCFSDNFYKLTAGCAYCQLFANPIGNCPYCPLSVGLTCPDDHSIFRNFCKAMYNNDRRAVRKAIDEMLKLIVKTKPDEI
jgi:hypothetical protein